MGYLQIAGGEYLTLTFVLLIWKSTIFHSLDKMK